jgi:hypothetical protein
MTRSLRYFQPEILPTRVPICSDMASAIMCHSRTMLEHLCRGEAA